MIEPLLDSLESDPDFWNEWETEFIENLEGSEFEDLSLKRQEKVNELWEKWQNK